MPQRQRAESKQGKSKPRYSKRARLWLSAVATLLQVVGVVIFAAWVLPALGVEVAWAWAVAFGAALVAFDIFTYIMGTHALDREVVRDLESMVGMTGKAATHLRPEGSIKVRGELWHARSVDGCMDKGAPVEVVGQEGLTLRVKKAL